jgi:hypothetical protein
MNRSGPNIVVFPHFIPMLPNDASQALLFLTDDDPFRGTRTRSKLHARGQRQPVNSNLR